jgi:predicted lipoprotein with Yx(FWY)xxD motif
MASSVRSAHQVVHARCRLVAVVSVVVAVLSASVFATAAVAAFSASPLKVATVTVAGKSKSIVVDSRGITVYELGGESLARLLCAPRACLNVWLPVRVPSATTKVSAATGVPGKVSILHRVKGGFYQLMLANHPLYYYSLDKGVTGSAKGQGLRSYGGNWHVVQVSSA